MTRLNLARNLVHRQPRPIIRWEGMACDRFLREYRGCTQRMYIWWLPKYKCMPCKHIYTYAAFAFDRRIASGVSTKSDDYLDMFSSLWKIMHTQLRWRSHIHRRSYLSRFMAFFGRQFSSPFFSPRLALKIRCARYRQNCRFFFRQCNGSARYLYLGLMPE